MLSITADQPFITFRPGTPTSWRGIFSGGTAPYEVKISWGDGTSESRASQGGAVDYSHTYDASQPYTVKITVTDQSGQSLTRYFGAIDSSVASNPSFGFSLTPAIDIVSDDPTFRVIIAYVAVLMIVLAMWWFEFTHHRRTIGVAKHYGWQTAHQRRNH